MGKNEKTPITIHGTEYNIEDLTEQQQMMVNHIGDLDRKIRSTQFNLDQLTVGKDETEANIARKIDAQKKPETLSGTPW